MSGIGNGIILKGIGGLYAVELEDGELLQIPAKGAFRHEKETPLAGDIVSVGFGRLEKILPRKNVLIRPPLANVSNMFITFAPTKPEPVLLNIDKLTAICEHYGIRPIIVITKTDLDPGKADEYRSVYESTGYRTFAVSPNGDDEIRAFVKDECREGVTCFAGASGVGKSSLMSRLFPGLELETGELSEKINRGKQTTRKAELFSLGTLFGDGRGGYIADTPGFSLLDFVRFDFLTIENLPYDFIEFDEYIGRCRYTKCTHLTEDGCAVCRAVEEGKINKSRHESYKSIYGELKGKNLYK